MYNMDNHDYDQEIKVELRKIQPIHGSISWILVVPKGFISILDIHKGDYVKCTIVGQELRIKKAEVWLYEQLTEMKFVREEMKPLSLEEMCDVLEIVHNDLSEQINCLQKALAKHREEFKRALSRL